VGIKPQRRGDAERGGKREERGERREVLNGVRRFWFYAF
jgi:hypothetical protein